MHVLNFAPNPYMLIPLIGMGIYGFLFYRIYNLRPQSNANKWFLIYLATSLAAGVMDLMGSISTTAPDATTWYLLFFVLNTLSFSSLFGFALSFTQNNKLADSPVVRVLLYIPALITSYFLLFSDIVIVHDSTKTTMIHLMWKLTEGKLRGPLYFGWIQLTVIGSIILFILYARRVHDHNRKVQSILYAASLFVQVVVDIVILNILPIALNIFIVPDGIVSVFFMGSILAFGILRYNLFVINPAAVASTIVDTMTDLLVVFNRDGNIEYINSAVSTTLGYEARELVGTYGKTILKDQWEQVNESLFKPILRSEKTKSTKTFFYKKEGTAVPVSISVSTVKESQNIVAGIVCVATDISQMIQLQDVTIQRDTLSTIIESLKDAVLAFDKEHKVSIYNSASLKIFSLVQEQVKGRDIAEIVHLYDGDFAIDVKKLIQQSIQNKFTVIQKNVIEAVDQSGKRVTVNLTITPVQDDAGLNLAGFIVLQDLSKEKQLEDMKLDFVSIAAHELRTPITSLRGYLSLVLDSYDEKTVDDQSTMIRRANISAQRLSSLIDNLLSISKIERGRMTIHMKPLDWLATVTQILSDISFQAKDKKITIELKKPSAPLPLVHADALLMNEVLSNLLSNAIAYTQSGGMITIWFESTQESIVTHICDTGEGIPKDSLPHLFTKFYRVSQPLEQGSKGTGLGLFISKSIVEMHKGKIWVESELGKGSTFSFSLLKAQ